MEKCQNVAQEKSTCCDCKGSRANQLPFTGLGLLQAKRNDGKSANLPWTLQYDITLRQHFLHRIARTSV